MPRVGLRRSSASMVGRLLCVRMPNRSDCCCFALPERAVLPTGPMLVPGAYMQRLLWRDGRWPALPCNPPSHAPRHRSLLVRTWIGERGCLIIIIVMRHHRPTFLRPTVASCSPCAGSSNQAPRPRLGGSGGLSERWVACDTPGFSNTVLRTVQVNSPLKKILSIPLISK